jgi:hypothetical protein
VELRGMGLEVAPLRPDSCAALHGSRRRSRRHASIVVRLGFVSPEMTMLRAGVPKRYRAHHRVLGREWRCPLRARRLAFAALVLRSSRCATRASAVPRRR